MENSKANEAAAEPPLDCRVGLLDKLRAYVNDDGDWAAGLLPGDVLAAADEIDRLREELKGWHDFGRAIAACAGNFTVLKVPNAPVKGRD